VLEPLNLERYEHMLEENRHRVSAARDFQEADRVPITIGLGGPYYAWIFGRTFHDYYNDLGVMLDTQVKGMKWRLSWLKDDVTDLGAWLDIGSIAEGIVFDCEIRMPNESDPWMSPWIVPRITALEEIERLEVPDPASHRGIGEYYERLERFRELTKRNYSNLPTSGGLQIHPPVSAAGSLLGPQRLYTWLYKHPHEMHKLFRKLEETFEALKEYNDAAAGSEIGTLGLSDDHAGYLSRSLYETFALPYNLELYRRYGEKRRTLHMDSHMDHVTDIIRDVYKVEEIDVGVENDIRVIAQAFKGKVVFNGNANWRALVDGSTEAIEIEVERCVFHCAKGAGYIFDNGGETYAGLPPERLRYEVGYAKKVGRYPLSIDNFKHISRLGGSFAP